MAIESEERSHPSLPDIRSIRDAIARLDTLIAEATTIRSILAAQVDAVPAGHAFLTHAESRMGERFVKIDVIKIVRAIANLGLREAKDGIEHASPSMPLALGYVLADDERIAELRALGCVVEIRPSP